MNSSDAKAGPQSATHLEMANAIRFLSADAVQAANSGHPGMPMGAADLATVLYTRFLKFDPKEPRWPDRDRFVLSAGHGSMLLYSILHLTGHADMDIGQLKNFRQLGSQTAGHPEFGAAAGIETTTGPLGQGLATAVGMAIAERKLANRFGDKLIDHNTYVLAGDGCLMEGISHEAASLAGHLRLSKLIVLFDDNQVSIDGETSLSVSDDQCVRFAAYGWDVVNVDGHNPEKLTEVIGKARASDRPSLIAARTVIGYGAPTKAGSSSAHGAPLGADEISAARENLDWSYPPFQLPNNVLEAWHQTGNRGSAARDIWLKNLKALDATDREAFERAMTGDLPATFIDAMSEYRGEIADEKPQMATRASSGRVLEVINRVVPETVGGSADLTGSNNTWTKDLGFITSDDFSGRYMHYGVREHAMVAAMNGLALHGGIIPYGGTFLVFSDYARGAIRLSALMGCRVIFVLTHDSIGLGEDGPTHQPVEHLAALRAIPNLNVYRPADAMEVAECWELALMTKDRPSVLVLTRQGVPAVRLDFRDENICRKGAYELIAANGVPQVTLIATGSEVSIAVAARNQLQSADIATRVVSMPCWELFEEQDEKYRQEILRPETFRIGVEAAVSMGWDRYLGSKGKFVGMKSFGASAPSQDLFEHFNITAEVVVDMAKAKLAEK